MIAIPWAEGADEELTIALGDYRWLKRALRKLRFARHPADVLAQADERHRTALQRLARLGRRRELPEFDPIVALQLRCNVERAAALDEAISTAERLDIPPSGDTDQMLRAIYRSPDRWPARPVNDPRGPWLTAWRLVASGAGSLQVLAGLLIVAFAPSAWAIVAVPVVSGALMLSSLFVRWKLFAGVLGALGSVLSWGAVILFFTAFRMC
jgi:hypothetical protein